MSTTLNIASQLQNSDTSTEFASIVGRVQGVNYQSFKYADNLDLHTATDEIRPDILVVEIDPKRNDQIESVEELAKQLIPSNVAVYVIFAEGSIELLRRLMRSGVKDVFQRPFQPQDIIQDITQAITEKRLRIKASTGGRGGITTFLNAKGGSGATTLAVNTAHMLATEHESSVALLDLDIQFGACALMLDLKPKSTIMDAVLQPERIDAVFLQAIMTKHQSGVDVLCSPADVSPMDRVTPEAINRIINSAVEAYDFVVMDVPRMITPWTMMALKMSEPIMIVSQNSLTTIRDAKILIDRLIHEGISTDNIELVNNRAMAKSGSVSIEKLKETLKKDKIHRVRNDYKTVVESQDQGRPAREVSSQSHFSLDIESLSRYLAKGHYGEPHKKKKGIFSTLFSR